MNNYAGITHQKIRRTPMLSALMEGCMEIGRDVICGGATYNSSGATIIGLAEVVDSVTAIQQFVYNKGAKPGCMLGAIETNWKEPYAKLHALVQHSREKFGRESLMAKNNADWLMGFINQKFLERPHYRGGLYTTGYWTMTMHAGLGGITQAFPSGRKDGETFASGITPVSGSAPELTPCLNFVGDFDHLKITNGQALNIKYFPPTAKVPAFASTIEAYFRGNCTGKPGGLQVQFNIIDREMLKDMMQHPKNYPPLMVRVSGYTAYFQDLNPQMQQEIITRAEYDLVDGYEHRYQDVAPPGNLPEAMTRLKAGKFLKSLEDEATDALLKTLLGFMKLAFWWDPDFRRNNIEAFTGSYRFMDRGDKVNILVEFNKGEMKFSSKKPNPKADVDVIFTDSAAILKFLVGDFLVVLENLVLADSLLVWDLVHFNFGSGLRNFLVAQDKALKGFVRAFKKDVLKAMLHNEFQVIGSHDSLYKFGFMANHPIRGLLKLGNKFG
ncbi:MAG: pyruvate formate lyase family protein [Syntrophobacterales bacterium]